MQIADKLMFLDFSPLIFVPSFMSIAYSNQKLGRGKNVQNFCRAPVSV